MDSYKILYQGVPTGVGSDTLLYTVPVRSSTSLTLSAGTADVKPSAVDQNVQTMVTQIIFCETANTGDTFDVHLAETVTASVDGNMVFKALTVGAHSTERLRLNWPLQAGNTIRVVPAAGDNVTITLLGIEVK